MRADLSTVLAIVLTIAVPAVPSYSADEPAPAATPPPEKPANPPAANGGAAETPPMTVLDKAEIQGVLGKSVRDATGKEMGRVVNVIVDKNGQPRAAVIDFGGFLGVGSRKIAVDWSALRFAPGDKPDPITLDLTRDEVKAAPEYKDGKPVVVLRASGTAQPMSGTSEQTQQPTVEQ